MIRDKTDSLRRKIKSRQALYGFSNYEMAVKLRMSERSWCRHLAEIDRVTVGELIELGRILKTNFIDTYAE